jgi:hypothetical protein
VGGGGAGSEFIDIGILNDCYPNCDLFGSEEKVAKAAWLKRLAYTLVGMEKRTAAWKAVRSVCYSQPLLDNLYLFTSHDISLYERNQEASCVLKKELKPLIKRYKSLSEDLNILVNRQDFQSIIVYRRALIEQLEMLNKATVELEILRDVTVKSGDVEMNAKDHYLYIMAAIVRSETGSLRLAELATLIEAGCLAHGHQDPFLSAGDISKRLLRFRTRRKLRLTAKGEPWYKCFSR